MKRGAAGFGVAHSLAGLMYYTVCNSKQKEYKDKNNSLDPQKEPKIAGKKTA